MSLKVYLFYHICKLLADVANIVLPYLKKNYKNKRMFRGGATIIIWGCKKIDVDGFSGLPDKHTKFLKNSEEFGNKPRYTRI